MVVEKSSTRRPTKLFVKIPSSLSAIVILKTPPACLRPRRDPKLRCHVREAIPGTKCSISRRPSLLASRSTGTNLAWRYQRGSGGFFESIVCYDGNGRLRPGGRPRSRFGGFAPGITLLKRRPDHPSRLSGRRRTIPAYRNRRPMPATGGFAGLLARANRNQGQPAGLRPALPATL